MKFNKEKIIVVIVGIVFAAIVFEIGLFLTTRIYEYRMKVSVKEKKISDNEKELNQQSIICLGNSFTFGLGAHRGKNFPNFLQLICDMEYPDKDILVYNCGLIGHNTRQVLGKLPGFIRKYSPSILIIRGGTPNITNTRGFEYYLQAHGQDNNKKFVEPSRMIVFAKMLTLELTKSVAEGYYESLKEKWEKLDPVEKKEMNNSRKKYYDVAQKLYDEKKPSIAFENYVGAVVNSVSKDEVFLEAFNKVQQLRVYAGKRKYKSAIKHMIDTSPLAVEQIYITDQEAIAQWVEYDIGQMVDIARAKGIHVIIQDYPVLGRNTYTIFYNTWITRVNEALRKVAKEKNVPFVDNASVFETRKGRKTKDYVPSPPPKTKIKNSHIEYHPDADGYEVMAEIVYDKIKELGWL